MSGGESRLAAPYRQGGHPAGAAARAALSLRRPRRPVAGHPAHGRTGPVRAVVLSY